MTMHKHLLAIAVLALGLGFATSQAGAVPQNPEIYDQPAQWDEYFLYGQRDPHGLW